MVSRAQYVLALVLLLPSFAGASDSFTKDGLKDEMPTMVSLASETVMFTEFIAQGQSRENFTREHAAYLLDSTRKQLNELQKKKPSTGIKGPYDECLRALTTLEDALRGISDRRNDLQRIHAQAEQALAILRQAASSL
jgi:hypothetical protein